MSEGYIQFVADYEGWQAIKKIAVNSQTDPRRIMEFLASLTVSVDNKVESNLRKVIDLEKVDAVLTEAPIGRAAEDLGKVIAFLNSRALVQTINAVSAKEQWQKGEQEEIAQFIRVYCARKLLKECKIFVDYSMVEIPGMKRLMKKKG